MSMSANMMFLVGGFGTSSARTFQMMPMVRKFASMTPVIMVNMSMLSILALVRANTRTQR